MTDPTIMWNRTKLEAFKEVLSKVEGEGAEVFNFEGHEILCAYAEYLVEYLETRLPKSSLESAVQTTLEQIESELPNLKWGLLPVFRTDSHPSDLKVFEGSGRQFRVILTVGSDNDPASFGPQADMAMAVATALLPMAAFNLINLPPELVAKARVGAGV